MTVRFGGSSWQARFGRGATPVRNASQDAPAHTGLPGDCLLDCPDPRPDEVVLLPTTTNLTYPAVNITGVLEGYSPQISGPEN